MSEEVKYVNVALNAYGQTTTYICEIEDIKKGDFVIVQSMSGELTGRIMSYAPKKVFSISLAKPKKVIRKANPQEINEVADLFGIKKNPEFAAEEEDDSFLTNSGYGTKELNKIMKKYQEKQNKAQKLNVETAKAEKNLSNGAIADDDKVIDAAESDIKTEEVKKQRLLKGPIKEDSQIPDYWRYVAIGMLALYFLKDYIFE